MVWDHLQGIQRPFFVAEIFEKMLEKRLKRKKIPPESAKYIVRRVGTKIPEVRAVEVGILSHPLAVYPALEAFKEWPKFEREVLKYSKARGWEVLKIRTHPGPSKYMVNPGGILILPKPSDVFEAKRAVDAALKKFSEQRGVERIAAKFYGFEKNKKFFTPYSDLDWELTVNFSNLRRGQKAFFKLVHEMLDIEKRLGVKVVPYRVTAFEGNRPVGGIYKDTVMHILERKARKPGPGFEPG